LERSLLLELFDLDFALCHSLLVPVVLLLVPLEQLLQELLHVDVRDVVVLSDLLGVEGFASTGWSHYQDLDRPEVALFCKLGLDEVDLLGQTWLAEPVHLYDFRFLATFSVVFTTGSGLWVLRLDEE
jgi:hypothetical protein